MRTRTRVAIVMASAGLLLTAVPARAHHSFAAEFDATKPVKLRGLVTKVEWINPHTWIHIDVRQPDGSVVKWMIEGGTPNTLFRRGITRESLPAGVEIVLDGYQAKNGTTRANGRDITLADGRKLFLGTPAPPGGAGAPQQ